MQYLFEQLGYNTSHLSLLLVNNRLATQVAKNPKPQLMMEHMHYAYHWICDQVKHRQIVVSYIPGDENPANIFTKLLARPKFTKF